MPTVQSLIIGPGAIGTLACAQAQTYGPVRVFGHRANLSLARRCLREPIPIELEWQLLDANDQSVNLIWTCCKVYHAQATTQRLLTRFPEAVAILLHNGMGPQSRLADQFPGRILWGTTTCGALQVDPKTYRQTGYGQTHLGLPPHQPDQPEQSPAAAALDQIAPWQGPLNLTVSDQMEALLWQKLLVNAVLNPITAARQISNGALLQGQFDGDIAGICAEIGQIMHYLQLAPIVNPAQWVHRIATLTAENRSSMAEDVRCGRRTEIDYINGFLIESARRFNLATPFLTKWYKKIAHGDES